MKKKLDYLLIPDASKKCKKERKERAKKELNKRIIENVLIIKGRDSEEDILYLGKISKDLEFFNVHVEDIGYYNWFQKRASEVKTWLEVGKVK